jgi:hypothetical protein
MMAKYESAIVAQSALQDGVSYKILRISFTRRVDLMRQVRELAARAEFLKAGTAADDKMDAALLQRAIDALYLNWGLLEVNGIEIDGEPATPTLLLEAGPEELSNEALRMVKAEIGLTDDERKN